MLKLGRDLNSEQCFSILKLQIFHRTYLYLFMWKYRFTNLSYVLLGNPTLSLQKEVKMEEEGLVCSAE